VFGDFFRALSELFTDRRSRLEVSGLLLTMALLPVSELVVTRMFSQLILHGPERFDRDPNGVVVDGSIFFLAFALSRAIHHVVRLNRVRVFRRGFDSSGRQHPASREAWSWAAAFELSTAMVSLIQIAAFCLLFMWFDLGFGAANLVIGGGVLWLIALIYRRQLAHQLTYLSEGTMPGSTAVGERVGKRIRDAELGAVVASLAMAFSLAVVLYRAVHGSVGGADAIVLFIGLRMMYSQVGNLSASAMRFARVKARLTVGQSVGVVDPEDEFDDPDEEIEDVEDLQPARPSTHRAQLVGQMIVAGQRGELDQVQRFGARLGSGVAPTEQEERAQQAAEAFALLAASFDDRMPLSLMWWARPFPGSVGNWLSPLLLQRLSGRAVLFRTPASSERSPHLVMIGSLAGSAHRDSIVIGTGALNADVAVDPLATYLSVRGPLTADALHKAGGPAVDAYGDPTVLMSRFIPVERTAANGRLAFVRHVTHADVPVKPAGHMDELSPLASRPEDIETFLRTLATYEGVVTSDFSTAAICHSYGLPCAPITFDGHSDLGFVFRDYALGLGLGEDTAPAVVDPDLGRVRWDDLLVTRTVAAITLDAVQHAVERGVATYLERVDPA
jgi:hypothetical protein